MEHATELEAKQADVKIHQGVDYSDPYGTWEVTTEGDVEGRSTTDLGVFTGFIDDIAKRLADKCYYSLCFIKKNTDANSIPIHPTEHKEVSVSLGINSETWDMNEDNRTAFLNKMLANRPAHAEHGQYYASVIIHFDE